MDEEEHRDLTSNGPTQIGGASPGRGEVEEKENMGWSGEERRRRKEN